MTEILSVGKSAHSAKSSILDTFRSDYQQLKNISLRTKIILGIALAFIIGFSLVNKYDIRGRASSEQSNVVQTNLPGGKREVPDHVLVKFKDNLGQQIKNQVLADHQLEQVGEISHLDVKITKIPPGKTPEEVIEKLLSKNANDVEYAEPDFIAQATTTLNDPLFPNQPDFVQVFDPQAFDVTIGSASVIVGLADTGIDSTHPDLGSKIVNKVNFSTSSTVEDVYGHGTHTAGTVAAITNNNTGVAGSCPNCMLQNIKVLGDDSTGSYSSIANGITWAADNGAKVVSLSLGGTSASSTLQRAVDYAWNKGLVVVAAAGNNGVTNPFYPAYYSNAIAVGAVDASDTKAYFSNYGSWVDVAAPGVSIYSTLRGNSYGTKSGTSMSTPHVAGLAGLLFSLHPTWTNVQVREAIEKSADKTAGTGTYWMYGRINAYAAVQYSSTTTPPTTAPSPTAIIPTPTSGSTDTIAPTVSITSPLNGTTVNRNSSLTVSASATDNTAVTKVEFYLNGALQCSDTTAPYNCGVKIPGKPNASYQISAKAYDSANNTASVAISITAQ